MDAAVFAKAFNVAQNSVGDFPVRKRFVERRAKRNELKQIGPLLSAVTTCPVQRYAGDKFRISSVRKVKRFRCKSEMSGGDDQIF